MKTNQIDKIPTQNSMNDSKFEKHHSINDISKEYSRPPKTYTLKDLNILKQQIHYYTVLLSNPKNQTEENKEKLKQLNRKFDKIVYGTNLNRINVDI